MLKRATSFPWNADRYDMIAYWAIPLLRNSALLWKATVHTWMTMQHATSSWSATYTLKGMTAGSQTFASEPVAPRTTQWLIKEELVLLEVLQNPRSPVYEPKRERQYSHGYNCKNLPSVVSYFTNIPNKIIMTTSKIIARTGNLILMVVEKEEVIPWYPDCKLQRSDSEGQRGWCLQLGCTQLSVMTMQKVNAPLSGDQAL